MLEETNEARTPKALPIPPQLVVGDPGRTALRGEGGLPLENGTESVIAG